MGILYSDREIVICIKPVSMDSEAEFPAAPKETLVGNCFNFRREGGASRTESKYL